MFRNVPGCSVFLVLSTPSKLSLWKRYVALEDKKSEQNSPRLSVWEQCVPFKVGKSERIIHVLVYLKDSNAAAHSVDSDIFYAVIHLQLYS